MASNMETVQGIYAAFARGDVPHILSTLSPDVDWEGWPHNFAQDASVPWLARRRGPDGVVAFFQIVGGWTVNGLEVHEVMTGGNAVSVALTTDFTLPNGSRIQDEEIHLWRFDDEGRVVQLRHYVDTAKHIAAARAEAG